MILLFVSVLLVNYLIGDGKSHWLEGVMLMTMYLIIAIAGWYVPSTYHYSLSTLMYIQVLLKLLALEAVTVSEAWRTISCLTFLDHIFALY